MSPRVAPEVSGQSGRVDRDEQRARVAAARVGRLATVTVDGDPHLVPCCFAVVGPAIVTAVDAKPKSTTALRRLDNIRSTARAALLVDHYDDTDWTLLWWVRVDGTGRILEAGSEREAAVGLLRDKYPQYVTVGVPGPVVAIDVDSWRSWP